jgi:hypothetical protein
MELWELNIFKYIYYKYMPKRKIINKNDNNTNSIKKSIKKKKINSVNKVKSVNKVNVSNKVKSVNKIKNSKVNKITKILNNSSSNTNEHFMFNKVLNNALKNKNIFKTNLSAITNKTKFKSADEYQNDFNDIISFRKGLTKKDIDELNMIVYHDENNDGIFSASIAYNFLKTEGTNKNNISLLGLKPVKGNKVFVKDPDQYKGKNVLILDLDLIYG